MNMNKKSYKSLVEYNHLSSSSLIDGEQIYTIKDIKKEQIITENGKTSNVIHCYFKEIEWPMVLNITNLKTLERIFETEYIESWFDKQIFVYVKEGIKFRKDIVPGLRIKGVDSQIKPCEICGEIITATKNNTINDLIKISQEKYKQNICAKCLNNLKGDNNEITNK